MPEAKEKYWIKSGIRASVPSMGGLVVNVDRIDSHREPDPSGERPFRTMIDGVCCWWRDEDGYHRRMFHTRELEPLSNEE